jgi:signal peptidase II
MLMMVLSDDVQDSNNTGSGSSPSACRLSASSMALVAAIVVAVFILDQVSKFWVLAAFERGEVLEVIPGLFNITLHFNPGVAFGLFADLGEGLRTLVLAGTTTVAIAFVLYFLLVDYRDDRVGQSALALVLGGALGNIVDRIRLGEVVDFFDFYIGSAHWPTFNVADSAICIGVAVLLIKGVLDIRKLRTPKVV